jgi:pimeloyl-ACP methyl ester carboxylesterase
MGDQWEPFESYNIDRANQPGMVPRVMKLLEAFGMAAIPPSDLERITVPTTLVWGRHDRAIPLKVAETASARFGWPLVILEDSADDPPMAEPEALARAINGGAAFRPNSPREARRDIGGRR